MRYRIIIEVDTVDDNRVGINRLAMEMTQVGTTVWSKPVYVATEVVNNYLELAGKRETR